MMYFVSYDIANQKRLVKIAKTLENYGIRVQFSFFQCEMEKEQFECLKRSLLSIINMKEDSLFFYPICEDCLKNTSSIGKGSIFFPKTFEIL